MRRYWLYSCRYHFPLNLLYFLAGDVPVFLASYEYLASARSTYLRPFDTDAFVAAVLGGTGQDDAWQNELEEAELRQELRGFAILRSDAVRLRPDDRTVEL